MTINNLKRDAVTSGKTSDWIRKTTAATIFVLSCFVGEARAFDLDGWTIEATGLAKRTGYHGDNKDFTYPLEIYFGTKGDRFLGMGGTTGHSRILIPAGSNHGWAQRADAHFTQIVDIAQSPTLVHVVLQSRGLKGYANEEFTWDVSIGNGTCHVDKFRYDGDPELFFSTSSSAPGDCKLTQGPPEGLTSN